MPRYAHFASPTRSSGIYCDALSNLKGLTETVTIVVTQFCHDPGKLMSKDEWLSNARITDSPIKIRMQIRTTDSDGGDFYAYFSLFERLFCWNLLYTQVTG
jgi:hypothetical protein